MGSAMIVKKPGTWWIAVVIMVLLLGWVLFLTFRSQPESQFPSCGPVPSGHGCL
jgi:predicted acyltransferase